MAPQVPSVGPLASALGVGSDDTNQKTKVAVSTKPPMNQPWAAVVSGHRGTSAASSTDAPTSYHTSTASSTSPPTLMQASPVMSRDERPQGLTSAQLGRYAAAPGHPAGESSGVRSAANRTIGHIEEPNKHFGRLMPLKKNEDFELNGQRGGEHLWRPTEPLELKATTIDSTQHYPLLQPSRPSLQTLQDRPSLSTPQRWADMTTESDVGETGSDSGKPGVENVDNRERTVTQSEWYEGQSKGPSTPVQQRPKPPVVHLEKYRRRDDNEAMPQQTRPGAFGHHPTQNRTKKPFGRPFQNDRGAIQQQLNKSELPRPIRQQGWTEGDMQRGNDYQQTRSTMVRGTPPSNETQQYATGSMPPFAGTVYQGLNTGNDAPSATGLQQGPYVAGYTTWQGFPVQDASIYQQEVATAAYSTFDDAASTRPQATPYIYQPVPFGINRVPMPARPDRLQSDGSLQRAMSTGVYQQPLEDGSWCYSRPLVYMYPPGPYQLDTRYAVDGVTQAVPVPPTPSPPYEGRTEAPPQQPTTQQHYPYAGRMESTEGHIQESEMKPKEPLRGPPPERPDDMRARRAQTHEDSQRRDAQTEALPPKREISFENQRIAGGQHSVQYPQQHNQRMRQQQQRPQQRQSSARNERPDGKPIGNTTYPAAQQHRGGQSLSSMPVGSYEIRKLRYVEAIRRCDILNRAKVPITKDIEAHNIEGPRHTAPPREERRESANTPKPQFTNTRDGRFRTEEYRRPSYGRRMNNQRWPLRPSNHDVCKHFIAGRCTYLECNFQHPAELAPKREYRPREKQQHIGQEEQTTEAGGKSNITNPQNHNEVRKPIPPVEGPKVPNGVVETKGSMGIEKRQTRNLLPRDNQRQPRQKPTGGGPPKPKTSHPPTNSQKKSGSGATLRSEPKPTAAPLHVEVQKPQLVRQEPQEKLPLSEPIQSRENQPAEITCAAQTTTATSRKKKRNKKRKPRVDNANTGSQSSEIHSAITIENVAKNTTVPSQKPIKDVSPPVATTPVAKPAEPAGARPPPISTSEERAAQARYFKTSLAGTLKGSRGPGSPIVPTHVATTKSIETAQQPASEKVNTHDERLEQTQSKKEPPKASQQSESSKHNDLRGGSPTRRGRKRNAYSRRTTKPEAKEGTSGGKQVVDGKKLSEPASSKLPEGPQNAAPTGSLTNNYAAAASSSSAAASSSSAAAPPSAQCSVPTNEQQAKEPRAKVETIRKEPGLQQQTNVAPPGQQERLLNGRYQANRGRGRGRGGRGGYRGKPQFKERGPLPERINSSS